MKVTTLHPEYEQFLPKWQRARDVIAGEDEIKRGGTRYLPKLTSQTDEEYAAYLARATFFNGTARTQEGFLGMIFRREPVVKLPMRAGKSYTESHREAQRALRGEAVAEAFKVFEQDVDLLGTSLYLYAKRLTGEVLAVGRAGTLIEWNEEEDRAFAALYRAEQIINWRTERIGGRNELSLLVLHEVLSEPGGDDDPFSNEEAEQVRVLRLVRAREGHGSREGAETGTRGRARSPEEEAHCVVEVYRKGQASRTGDASRTGRKGRQEWVLVERRAPMRRGQPLRSIPFVFHGPYDSLPDCAKPPLDDVIAINLEHFRLNADYKHGMHFTALPTAWVAGFPKDSRLKIGSSTAWVSEVPGAQAGFLEFTGQGLTTFERAMDRAERLMAILGSKLLETQKRVSESAEALSLRQAGEGSIIANISGSISKSITQILRWMHYWHASPPEAERPEAVGEEVVSFTLNQDFETAAMTPSELSALVAAWQSGALSRDSMHNLMRRGELLEPGRTNEEEAKAIAGEGEKVTQRKTE